MKKIRTIVADLLTKSNVTAPPVPVKKIAKSLALTIKSYDLGPGVSGALLIDQDKAVIGINPDESNVRTRFTIAHEIGHFCLHRNDHTLFVDRDVLFKGANASGTQMLFRDGKSTLGEIKIEKEANAFAAELLMPVEMLAKEINSLNLEEYPHHEDIINELAKRFRVSSVAMTFRLSNVGLLHC